jgi:hypothetical protein
MIIYRERERGTEGQRERGRGTEEQGEREREGEELQQFFMHADLIVFSRSFILCFTLILFGTSEKFCYHNCRKEGKEGGEKEREREMEI